MSKLVSLDLTQIQQVRCPVCELHVPRQEFHGDTDQCLECHDNGDTDDCRCERCFDRQVSAADFMGD